MRDRTRRVVVLLATFATAFGIAGVAQAQLGVGTWVRQKTEGSVGEMTMTVEECCNGGRRLIYRLKGHEPAMVVESAFDGKEAPASVDGKLTGETMAITRVDSHHTSTVVKTDGQPYATSKAALSDDGRTLTVENERISTDGSPGAKSTEIWVKQ